MALRVDRTLGRNRAARLLTSNSTSSSLHQFPDTDTRRGFIGRETRLAHNRPSTYELPFYFPPDVSTDFVLPVMPHGVTKDFSFTAIGSWLENYRGTVKRRNANNTLAKYRMKLRAGDHPPRRMPCIDPTHEHIPVNFIAGTTNNETENIGFWFQICKDLTQNKKTTHFIYLTPPLTIANVNDDPWLWAALEHRKLLAPGTRERKKTPDKKTPGHPRCRRGQAAKQRISPDVLPDTPAPPSTLTRSPSERSDTELGYPDASTVCASCDSTPSHRNVSPPSPPADVSMVLSSDDELLNFRISDYNQEAARRRRAGLPSSRTCKEVDIDIRFFLPDRILDTVIAVNNVGRACLENDEDFLFQQGFPKDLVDYLWMLVPYTEADPIWQKMAWDDAFSVNGALSLQFQLDLKPLPCA